MSKPQIITTETGEELVVLTRHDYDAMLARAGDEDAEDRMTERIVTDARARGDIAIPVAVWREIEATASPVAPLRKWRGLTQTELSHLAGISQGYLSEIETGKKTGDIKTLRAIAHALRVGVDDVTQDEQLAMAALHTIAERAMISLGMVRFRMVDQHGNKVACSVTRDFIEERFYGGRDIPDDELNAAFEASRGDIETLVSKKFARGDIAELTVEDLIPPARPGTAIHR
jgi:transcriptional regulator with XRE-family HTH domain